MEQLLEKKAWWDRYLNMDLLFVVFQLLHSLEITQKGYLMMKQDQKEQIIL